MWTWLRFRALRFRREAVVLAYALFDTQIPALLRLASLASAAYLLSPIDLIPITVPLLGVLDDVIIVPWITGLIAQRLPEGVRLRSGQKADQWISRWLKRPLLALLIFLVLLFLVWAAILWLLWSAIWGS